MRVWSQKMTGWLKDSRGWLAAQPVVVAVTKPQELRGRDLGQTLVQIFVPILALVLVVGGGIGVVFTGPQTPVPAEEELAAQNIEVAAASEPSELEVFELEDFELEEYHSVSQYSANLEQYRKAISSLRPFKHWQRIRQEQMLSSLEVREWVAVGSAGTELCFQHSKTLECIEIETLETLQESGKEFAEANPQGFGLCYDWFGGVCMSGDWFDSKERFTSVINSTREYVMTGEWPVETSELALEASPTYEPTATALELQPGTLEWLDAQGEPTSRVFEEALSGDLDGCADPRTGEACSADELLAYAKRANDRWEEANPEGFSVCYDWDRGVCMAGEAYSSEAEYEEAMRAQEEWDRTREGECSGSMTLNGGPEVCTHVWQGSPGNWISTPIPYTYPDGYGWVDPNAPEPPAPNENCDPGQYFDGEGCWASREHYDQWLSRPILDNENCASEGFFQVGEDCWASQEAFDQHVSDMSSFWD